MKVRIKNIQSLVFGTDWWLYALVAVCCIYFSVFAEIIQSPDTKTYISAWVENMSHGEIDAFRTPVYPLYLGLMMIINKSHFLFLAVVGQHLVFLISLYYLKKMLTLFTDNHSLICLSFLSYALFQINWNNCILTESFAISGMVFLFYCILSFYKEGRILYIAWATIWLMLLVFLRPAFLFLFPACFIAYGLFYKKYGKKVLTALFGVLFVGMLEFGYCKSYEERYGLFLPSSVSVYNNFQIGILEGAISSDYSDNEDVKEYISELPDFYRKSAQEWWNYNGTHSLPIALDTKEQASIVSRSRKEQPTKWILSCWHHFFDSLTMRFPVELGPFSVLLIIISGTILMTNGILIIYFLFCCVTTVRRRRVPIVSIILWTTVIGNFATIIIGAQAEWARLFSPSLPLLTLMIVQLLGFINWKAIWNYNEEDHIAK